VKPWITTADRLSDWSRARVVVAGLGRSGFAAADGLLELGAQVTVLDDADTPHLAEKATLLEVLDAQVRLGDGATAQLPEHTDLVIASPGWSASAPLLAQAQQRGIPIWGEVELAWRMTQPDGRVPWLGVTGARGRTTTITMLAAIMEAAGVSAAVVGNIGRPVVEAVLDETPYDVFLVELSGAQLRGINSVSLHSAVVLNLATDLPGSLAAADAGIIYERVQQSCVYDVADPAAEQLVADAEVIEGARAIGYTLGIPAPSMLGVVDDVLVDRAFIAQRRDSAVEVAKLTDLPATDPDTVANALAAAALARSFAVSPQAVAEGLRRYAAAER
jgi:UDP-N-acetylmuramoylalanine--D-glutamate ligase